MSILADSNGYVRGKFQIPKGIPAGRKLVRFTGSAGSHGESYFDGGGEVWTERKRQVDVISRTHEVTVTSYVEAPPPPPQYCWKERDVLEPNPCVLSPGSPGYILHEQTNAHKRKVIKETYRAIDPLAQTFRLDKSLQVGAVELWVSNRGNAPITVQIRETSMGMPSTRILGVAEQKASSLINGRLNRWVFDEPIALSGGEEYAVVVLTDDANAALGIAEIGKWDSSHSKWVTSQPYTVGVLLSSSNASTWTAHQGSDLTFRLLEAKYSVTTREFELGPVELDAATDLMLMANVRSPSSACRLQFEVTLPDESKIFVSPFVAVPLPSEQTGTATVKATVIGTQSLSPVLEPFAQIAHGKLTQTADYVTRLIPCGSNTKLVAIFDALIPSGASVTPTWAGDGDPGFTAFDSSSAISINGDWVEYRHEVTSVTKTLARLKLELAGTIGARPLVKNLRFMAI